ncbi:type VII secretion protein EccB [Mycolicibacterium mucogenicum]|uniref:type VII secretion protein EccB n=2 Tax=Mycolicibacterium mucogenicum TaxID=56689 RepID=UPI00076A3C13|nr:type VII secretion protein EccB [Mycolicibacterium mucogenicum]
MTNPGGAGGPMQMPPGAGGMPPGPTVNPAGTSRRQSGLQRVMTRSWTTRMQVSGWRFMVHRLEHALVRRDTSMRQDPLRAWYHASMAGVVIAILFAAGATVMSFISGKGVLKDNIDIAADRDTTALFVRVNGVMHPVLNLPSAQLIIGKPKNPSMVRSSELANVPRGSLLGIPGAPLQMPNPANTKESHWSVCDTTSPAGATTVTVLSVAPTLSAAVEPLASGSAILAGYGNQAFLVYRGHRTPINLQDKAVALAVGIDSSAPPVMPVSRALYDSLAETPPLVVPAIAAAGTPAAWHPDPSVVVGSVLKVRPVDGGDDAYYVMLTDGVQRISAVTAAIIRNADPRNPPPPIEVAPNALLAIPESKALDVGFYPDKPVKLVDPVANPVTCLSWTQSRDESKPRTQVLSGHSLPLPDNAKPVSVVTADPNKGTANDVYIPPGTGVLVQISGGSPTAPTGESQWYVGDTGVRYGLVSTTGDTETPQSALGLTAQPLPAPWSIISLLPAGPALSKQDALLAHDSLPMDPNPSVLSTRAPGAGGS